jgi:hypothetical protein
MVLIMGISPAAARASAYTEVLHTYQANGSIPPCAYSSDQLSSALKGIDTYGQQYFADFSNAVQNALAARASGACARGVPPVTQSAPVPAPPALPSSATAATDADVPAPIVLMAAVAAVVAAALAIRAIARAGGWEPRWTPSWRHAWGEAGYRVGGGWEDFLDWLRRRR